MKTIALVLLAACGTPEPHHGACIVGKTCPDASIDAPADASYPSCAEPVPILPACTCGDYFCSGDGGVEHHSTCGPPCDAGHD